MELCHRGPGKSKEEAGLPMNGAIPLRLSDDEDVAWRDLTGCIMLIYEQ